MKHTEAAASVSTRSTGWAAWMLSANRDMSSTASACASTTSTGRQALPSSSAGRPMDSTSRGSRLRLTMKPVITAPSHSASGRKLGAKPVPSLLTGASICTSGSTEAARPRAVPPIDSTWVGSDAASSSRPAFRRSAPAFSSTAPAANCREASTCCRAPVVSGSNCSSTGRAALRPVSTGAQGEHGAAGL